MLGKVPSKHAEPVAATTIALLTPHKAHTQTITADNGLEFAHHATISQALDAAVYFAHPYQAGQRGLNENTNGLIRQYVPKGMALDTLSDTQIRRIMARLNHRPRKGLAFQTPGLLTMCRGSSSCTEPPSRCPASMPFGTCWMPPSRGRFTNRPLPF